MSSPDNALREYPRPQMERPEWVNLNGLWDYAIVPTDTAGFPKKYQGKILVPYPVESALSGVMKSVGAKNRVWYNPQLRLPESWKGRRILLNFGAVDWDTTVYINDKKIGAHYRRLRRLFLDITNNLQDGFNTVSVSVWDPHHRRLSARRQAARQAPGHLVHPHHRHLADRLGRGRPQNLHPLAEDHADIDKGEVGSRRRGRQGRSRFRDGGEQEVASGTSADGRVHTQN